eukprot:gene4144-5655_t
MSSISFRLFNRTALLEDVTGLTPHGVTGALLAIGVGLTLGNLVGGRLADRNLRRTVIGAFAGVIAVLALLALTVHMVAPTMVLLVAWGALAFALLRHNVFFSADYAAEFAALGAGRLADSPSVYLCAQDRGDAETAHEGAERFQIIVNAPATGDGAPLSAMEIDRCTQAMRATLSRAGLSIDLPP